MHLNTDPVEPPRKPCARDMNLLTTTLLIPALVKLVPLDELRRRGQEIMLTHPQYREEVPLVVEWETQRRQYLSQGMHVAVQSIRVA